MTTNHHRGRSARILSALASALTGPYAWPLLARGQYIHRMSSPQPRRPR